MENEQEQFGGHGIPKCDCGQCINELEDESGDIIVTMETLKIWFSKVCPLGRNPNPPPVPGPGTPLRLAA